MKESFRKKWEHRIRRGLREPNLILPFLRERFYQYFLRAKVRRKLEERGGVFIARGGVKEVYRVPLEIDGKAKDYAVSFFRKPFSEQGSIQEYVEKIRNTRAWYERTLGKEFLNEEKVFPQEKAGLVLYVQPWVYSDKGKSALLSQIPKNLPLVFKEMRRDTQFRQQMVLFAERVLREYKRSGLFPDMFHTLILKKKAPQNVYVSEDGRIFFLDTHTVYYDPERGEQPSHLLVRKISERMRPFFKELVMALETIAHFSPREE